MLDDVVADRRLVAERGRRADGVRVEPLLRVGAERLLRLGRDDVGAAPDLDVDLGGAVVRLGLRVEVLLALVAVQVAVTDLPALADAVVGGGDHSLRTALVFAALGLGGLGVGLVPAVVHVSQEGPPGWG
ncbi:hypothetical protein SSP24_24130 [Streptomyces spinoverrucosus]|uniref:Uncharacterized protein n=1 Tax=Streptomyces spinoverrucosus TaxID=284043 RepID=A0A4Y3VF99_9ACTN|nr:hypothetical protein SSP24_24130 [Streptomyces spinoverrucosus]GHB59473.1 hypothetical protein GCM10010397_31970 [Streptomyces spinoverrucosus]